MPTITSMQACQTLRRMHWGCGGNIAHGWINCDRQSRPGIDIPCDILERGLPLPPERLDCIVSVHALQEIPFDQQLPVLRELRRVLRPRGVLRLCLPDAEKAMRAYLAGEGDHFAVPDEDFASLGGKFVAHILWYGHSRVLYTTDFIEELLHLAGFTCVHHCACGQSQSDIPGITDLDNRQHESLYVEAVK